MFENSGLHYLQHIPKINGEIPSVDEATLDHQRLLDRYKYPLMLIFDVEKTNELLLHFSLL